MVTPLIIGATRSLTQKTLQDTGASRISRARNLTSEKSNSQTASQTFNTQRSTRRTSPRSDTRVSSQSQKILTTVANMRLFMPLLTPLIFVSVIIAVIGFCSLFVLAASGTISWFTLGVVDMDTLGFMFIGFSLMLVIVSYIPTLLYFVVFKKVQPLSLTGLNYIGLFLLPIFDIVPGLNIFPWIILWAFILSMAPEAT